jgi:hypothetical protein
MTHIEQMEKWVDGESIHNGDKADAMSECCPDFSCCHEGMKWPREKREEFARAVYAGDDKKKTEMLMGSLGGLMDYTETRKVHISG